jgi:hypothetical protein
MPRAGQQLLMLMLPHLLSTFLDNASQSLTSFPLIFVIRIEQYHHFEVFVHYFLIPGGQTIFPVPGNDSIPVVYGENSAICLEPFPGSDGKKDELVEMIAN